MLMKTKGRNGTVKSFMKENATLEKGVEPGGFAPRPPGFSALVPGWMWTGERERLAPESSRPRSRRSGRIPAEPYPPLRPRLVYSHGLQAASSEDLIPLALQGGDGTQFRQGDGHAVAQGEMGAEEVVVGDEEGGEGHGAIARGKAASGADVVLVGAIEAFDELLEGAKFFRYGVEIFQADHLSQGVRRVGQRSDER